MRIPQVMTAVLALAAAVAAAAGSAAGNGLVANGGFEKGSGAPDGWEKPDGLTVKWLAGGVRGGKAVLLDTTVLKSEFEQNRDNPGSVQKKSAFKGPGYDTVGGHNGAGLWSAPFTVEPGQWYLIEADVKAGSAQTSSVLGPPMVCLRGFRKATEKDVAETATLKFFHPVPDAPAFSDDIFGKDLRAPAVGDFLQVFRANMFCKVTPEQTGKWTHFVRPVRIQARTERFWCDTALVHITAFWPPSQYGFDNVSLRKITAAEAEAYKKQQAGTPAE